MTAPPLFSTLRRFVPGKKRERCELCGAPLGPEHPHLLELATRQLACACEPCGVLFDHRDGAKYRRIGRDVRLLSGVPISDAEWESLAIPIGLAFLVDNTALGRVQAFYPGPAGLTESLLRLDVPAARGLEPDIEALLVNRVGGSRDSYIVPIDRCYRLTGLIRKHWRGLSGGEEVWLEIEHFFADLREAAGA